MCGDYVQIMNLYATYARRIDAGVVSAGVAPVVERANDTGTAAEIPLPDLG